MIVTEQDYKKILKYYKINIPKNYTYKKIKKLGENILSSKLCRCIKKINPKNESKSMGICRNTIFNKRNLNFKKFTCKKKNRIYNLKKTKKNLRI